MKEIFMQLLLFLKDKGNITAAILYREGKYANLEVEGEDCIYSISISKEEKKGDTENA